MILVRSPTSTSSTATRTSCPIEKSCVRFAVSGSLRVSETSSTSTWTLRNNSRAPHRCSRPIADALWAIVSGTDLLLRAPSMRESGFIKRAAAEWRGGHAVWLEGQSWVALFPGLSRSKCQSSGRQTECGVSPQAMRHGDDEGVPGDLADASPELHPFVERPWLEQLHVALVFASHGVQADDIIFLWQMIVLLIDTALHIRDGWSSGGARDLTRRCKLGSRVLLDRRKRLSTNIAP